MRETSAEKALRKAEIANSIRGLSNIEATKLLISNNGLTLKQAWSVVKSRGEA